MSLFVADLVQAFGALMDVKWVHDDIIRVGPYCTAQGAIQQLGETVVALNTIVRIVFMAWTMTCAHSL